jgi:hypothetical protein
MDSEERVGFRSHSTSLARNLFFGPNSTAAPPEEEEEAILPARVYVPRILAV